MFNFSKFLFLIIFLKYKSNKTENISFVKKNLIIGAITNFNWQVVAPFFRSYQNAGFENCDCIMYVAKMSEETIEKIKSYGVIVYPILEKYLNLSIINYRWKLYEDYLNENDGKYKLVLTADLRDSIFQKNLFKLYENHKPFLGIAKEDLYLSESMNRQWLETAYGVDIAKSLRNKRIFCIGTLWGTVDKFKEASNMLWKKLGSEWSTKLNVIEQGVFNYLIYVEHFLSDYLVVSDNESGPVMTIGPTHYKYITFDSCDNILNEKGEVAAVVHQYERKPYITRKIVKKYCPEFNVDRSGIIYKTFNIISIYSLIIIIIFIYKFTKKKINLI
jgi:hypothetical protein